MVRNLAAVGQECIRTLRSERIFKNSNRRTFQTRSKLENDSKSQEMANTSDSLSKMAILARAPWRPQRRSTQFHLKASTYGSYLWPERVIGTRPHFLHISQSLLVFTKTFDYWDLPSPQGKKCDFGVQGTLNGTSSRRK